MQWEQQGDQGQTLDLRLTCKPDGTITVHNLKQTGQERSFQSPDEAANFFSSLIESGTGSR